MSYPNAVFSVFAFLGFLMCAIPFPWHLEAWNTGTCVYMFWVGMGCLNAFINSVVWNGNAINWAPVWCDISSKFIIGVGYGVPAAALCINRRLYRIASVKTVMVSKAEKRKAVFVDLAIGLVIPMIGMTLHYIVQGHRFNILEDVGCYPYTYPSIPTFFILYAPTLTMGLVSAYYAIRSIIEFKRSRSQFHEFLSGHSNLTSDRYLRLMVLSGTEVVCNVPLTIYFIVVNALGRIRPYKSWDYVHWGFHRVDQFAAVLWRLNLRDQLSIEATRWLVVICAFVFFLFFGFADEAKKNYRTALSSIAKKVGISTVAFTSNASSSGFGSSNGAKSKVSATKSKPPIMVHKEMLRQRDSMSSIAVSFADAGGLLSPSEEKKASSVNSFSPTQSYGGITLNDVGGTLEMKDDVLAAASPLSSVPTEGISSDASTLSSPISRSRSPSISVQPVEKAHTHDVV